MPNPASLRDVEREVAQCAQVLFSSGNSQQQAQAGKTLLQYVDDGFIFCVAEEVLNHKKYTRSLVLQRFKQGNQAILAQAVSHTAKKLVLTREERISQKTVYILADLLQNASPTPEKQGKDGEAAGYICKAMRDIFKEDYSYVHMFSMAEAMGPCLRVADPQTGWSEETRKFAVFCIDYLLTSQPSMIETAISLGAVPILTHALELSVCEGMEGKEAGEEKFDAQFVAMLNAMRQSRRAKTPLQDVTTPLTRLLWDRSTGVVRLDVAALVLSLGGFRNLALQSLKPGVSYTALRRIVDAICAVAFHSRQTRTYQPLLGELFNQIGWDLPSTYARFGRCKLLNGDKWMWAREHEIGEEGTWVGRGAESLPGQDKVAQLGLALWAVAMEGSPQTADALARDQNSLEILAEAWKNDVAGSFPLLVCAREAPYQRARDAVAQVMSVKKFNQLMSPKTTEKFYDFLAQYVPRCSNGFGKVDERISEGGLKLLICSGCKLPRYCSQRCQKEHWSSSHAVLCPQVAKYSKSLEGRTNRRSGSSKPSVSNATPSMNPTSAQNFASGSQQSKPKSTPPPSPESQAAYILTILMVLFAIEFVVAGNFVEVLQFLGKSLRFVWDLLFGHRV